MASIALSGLKFMRRRKPQFGVKSKSKRWKRDWKINLIERDNPHWTDLYPSLLAR
jgi:hypothetical protein